MKNKIGDDPIRRRERLTAKERLKKWKHDLNWNPGVADPKTLVNILLRGCDFEYKRCYLEDDSHNGKHARAALAGLLRSGMLRQDLCDALADLFDPVWRGEDRQLKSGHRGANRPKDTVLNSVIATHIYDFIKEKADNASVADGIKGVVAAGIESAVDEFGLGEKRIWKIWAKYKSAIEDTHGKLPSPRRGRRAK